MFAKQEKMTKTKNYLTLNMYHVPTQINPKIDSRKLHFPDDINSQKVTSLHWFNVSLNP